MRIPSAAWRAIAVATAVRLDAAPSRAALSGQERVAFEVSSIKRTAGNLPGGEQRRRPDGTFIVTNVSVRNVLTMAWPSEDLEYRNLPDWAIRDRYDIIVKPPAGASEAQAREMWRAMFRDRFKLEARYEPRDTPIYALVLHRADGRLGPRLKPSPHECATLAANATAPPAPIAVPPSDTEILASCRSFFQAGRMVSGGMLLSTLARALGAALVGRHVEDRTGLQGYYALTVTYAMPDRPGADPPADPGAGPSIFTALREQLGLRLEPARKALQTVVIDHIEPPTEN
jgi:uncharacterized protein (TIGR03435 family)